MLAKPAVLFASKVYTTIQASAADIVFSKGQIAFDGCGEPVILDKIVDITKKVYAAGTKQITTAAFAGLTVSSAGGENFTMTLLRKDTNQQVTYSVWTASGETTTTLAEKFNVKINADLSAFVTSTRSTTTLTLTEVSVSTGGVIVTAPTGVTVTVTTPHVDASGTVAEVAQYDPLVTSGTFRRYDFTVNKPITVGGGGKQDSEGHIVIWADEAATNFADFEARLFGTSNGEGILTGDYLDNTSAATLAASAEAYVEKV